MAQGNVARAGYLIKEGENITRQKSMDDLKIRSLAEQTMLCVCVIWCSGTIAILALNQRNVTSLYHYIIYLTHVFGKALDLETAWNVVLPRQCTCIHDFFDMFLV